MNQSDIAAAILDRSAFEAFLAAVTPASRSSEEKLSYNLSRWLKRNGGLFVRAFYAPEPGALAWDPAKTHPPMIYLGFPDDGWLHGARLSSILTMGTKADSWAYPPGEFDLPLVEITEAFWAAYIELGKCALDPEHSLYWPSDRFVESLDGGTRVCRWCARSEAREIRPMTVYQTSWKMVQSAS